MSVTLFSGKGPAGLTVAVDDCAILYASLLQRCRGRSLPSGNQPILDSGELLATLPRGAASGRTRSSRDGETGWESGTIGHLRGRRCARISLIVPGEGVGQPRGESAMISPVGFHVDPPVATRYALPRVRSLGMGMASKFEPLRFSAQAFPLMLRRRPAQHSLSAVAAARLAAVLEAVREDFSNPALTAAELARRQDISPRYLHRLIATTGKSLSAHLNELRLEHAHALLRETRGDKRRICDVALQSGFSDISYFNRLFRARYGETPTSVRPPCSPLDVGSRDRAHEKERRNFPR
jgi:AraC-like DNA-binding protein